MSRYQEKKVRWSKSLENDFLNHRQLLDHLTKLMISLAQNETALLKAGKVFIDAPWGYGKSEFVGLLDHIINSRYLNSNDAVLANVLTTPEKRIIHRMSAFSFNACELEVLNLPEYELILEIVSSVSKELGFTVQSSSVEKAAQDIGRLISLINEKRIVPEVLKSPLHSVNLYQDILTGRNIKFKLNQTIDDVARLNEYPLLVVLIDAIDKCQGETALRLLEFCDLFQQNAHLFFIFSGDRTVLEQNIRATRGHQFPAGLFLERHFGAFYQLQSPPVAGYCRHLFCVNRIDDELLSEACATLVDYYDLELDQIQRLVNELSLLANYFPVQKTAEFVFFKYFILIWSLTLKNKHRHLLKHFLLGEYSAPELAAIFTAGPDYLAALKPASGHDKLEDSKFLALLDQAYRGFLATFYDQTLYSSLLGDEEAEDLAAFLEQIKPLESECFENVDGLAFLEILQLY